MPAKLIENKIRYFEDFIIFKDDLIYLVNIEIQLEVIKVPHENPVSGHFDLHKIVELMKCSYWFTNMHEKIEDAINLCECARA